jgi:hypothetical protein
MSTDQIDPGAAVRGFCFVKRGKRRGIKPVALFLCLAGILPLWAEDRDQRIAELERQLAEARTGVATLQKTIESLSTDRSPWRTAE